MVVGMRINKRTRKKKKKTETNTAPTQQLSPHLALRGLPLLEVEVLGGTGLLVPRGTPSPPFFVVQYLNMDPTLLLLFFLFGEARAGACLLYTSDAADE